MSAQITLNNDDSINERDFNKRMCAQSESIKSSVESFPALFVSIEKPGNQNRVSMEITMDEFKRYRKEWIDNNWGFTVSHIVTGEIYEQREFDYISTARDMGFKIQDEDGSIVGSIANERERHIQKEKVPGFWREFFSPLIRVLKRNKTMQ